MGTPHFMAPEVIMQTGHGRSADVWSIGCTVVEMYTGKPPFTEFTTAAAVMFHIAASSEMPSFPDFVSDGCKKFLARCFIRDPNKRATVDDLLQDPWIVGIPETSDDETESVSQGESFSDDTFSPVASPTGPPQPITDEEAHNPIIEPHDTPRKDLAIVMDEKEKKSEIIEAVAPKKGYDNKNDIHHFLKQNSLWQSRSFNSSAWESFKGASETQEKTSSSSDEGEITQYSEDTDPHFNGLSSMRTEFGTPEKANLKNANIQDNLEDRPLEKKKKERLKKVRRKLEEELSRGETSTTQVDQKKEKKKIKKKQISIQPSQKDLSPNNEIDDFPVIEIPKKTNYVIAKEIAKQRDNVSMSRMEQEKIYQMEKELSNMVDEDPRNPFQQVKSAESPKKILQIPHSSHSKSKSPITERGRIKSAPIKRVSSDEKVTELSETLSPITQLGKVTSPTKAIPKPLPIREYR